MCLYTKETKTRRAIFPKHVYKRGRIEDSIWRSPYFASFFGNFGEVVRAKNSDNTTPLENLELIPSTTRDYYFVEKGLHALHTYYKTKSINSDFEVMHAIIPKGAEYVKGIMNEIVSTHLIVCKNKRQFIWEYIKCLFYSI